MIIECTECGSSDVKLKCGPGLMVKPKKISLKKIAEIDENTGEHYICSWWCENCYSNWAKVSVDGKVIEAKDFIENARKHELSNPEKSKHVKSFTTFEKEKDLEYLEKDLEKMKKENPRRDIPEYSVVKIVANSLKPGKDKVIDDLIIRNFDGIIQLELI
jgi:hypothetical protein